MSNQNDAIDLLAGKPTCDPTPEQFCLEVGLYDAKPKAACLDTLATLRFDPFQFDAHCLRCKKTSTFHSTHQPYRPNNRIEEAKKNGPFSRSVKCTRADHFYTYYFLVQSDCVVKVGQYPSIQDVAGAELREFRAVLSDEDVSELNKATGLFSHGIGIGSFVYLRRIFERLMDAHRQAQEKQNGAIPNWERMRMDERIGALKDVLPPALVQHRSVYGILSKGIHELSENQCRKYFPAVRQAIIMILQQDLDAKRRAQREAELQKELAAINSELNA